MGEVDFYGISLPYCCPPIKNTSYFTAHVRDDGHQVGPKRWISMVTMTASIKRFVVNCLYTLHKYGGQPHYIVATFDPVSLSVCKSLNLPCLNGTDFNTDPMAIEDGERSKRYDAVKIWGGGSFTYDEVTLLLCCLWCHVTCRAFVQFHCW